MVAAKNTTQPVMMFAFLKSMRFAACAGEISKITFGGGWIEQGAWITVMKY